MALPPRSVPLPASLPFILLEPREDMRLCVEDNLVQWEEVIWRKQEVEVL